MGTSRNWSRFASIIFRIRQTYSFEILWWQPNNYRNNLRQKYFKQVIDGAMLPLIFQAKCLPDKKFTLVNIFSGILNVNLNK